jgi:hypothetical protein
MSLDPKKVGLRPNYCPCFHAVQDRGYEIHVRLEYASTLLPALPCPSSRPLGEASDGICGVAADNDVLVDGCLSRAFFTAASSARWFVCLPGPNGSPVFLPVL